MTAEIIRISCSLFSSTERGRESSEFANYYKNVFNFLIFYSLKLSVTATSVSIIIEATSLFPLSQALAKSLTEM